MNFKYRKGTIDDLKELKLLAVKSWRQFQPTLTGENWKTLHENLNSDKTFTDLLENSECLLCTTGNNKIIGMAFLVSSGNPTDIYDTEWSYIRFVSVDPGFTGKGIGRKLTTICIETARQNNEKVIALHTSEIMVKARHIYESLGFEILREINQRLGKRYWLYKLDL